MGAYRLKNFAEAIDYYQRALGLCSEDTLHGAIGENVYFNLGRAFRKTGAYEDAILAFKKSFRLAAHVNFSVYSSIGFTHHLSGNLHRAIQNYHNALALKPR